MKLNIFSISACPKECSFLYVTVTYQQLQFFSILNNKAFFLNSLMIIFNAVECPLRHKLAPIFIYVFTAVNSHSQENL